jgi:general stress protein 26
MGHQMTDTREHLHDLLSGFRSAMLMTRASDGKSHVRPMAVAKLGPNEELYFATGLASPKVDEISKNPEVTVSFQSSSEFAALYGTARVVTDRVLIDKLWSEAWKVWFPGGKEDPNLCLLAVAPNSAEYWDNSGVEGFKYLYEGLKAVLQKRTPETDDTQHAKVRL